MVDVWWWNLHHSGPSGLVNMEIRRIKTWPQYYLFYITSATRLHLGNMLSLFSCQIHLTGFSSLSLIYSKWTEVKVRAAVSSHSVYVQSIYVLCWSDINSSWTRVRLYFQVRSCNNCLHQKKLQQVNIRFLLYRKWLFKQPAVIPVLKFFEINLILLNNWQAHENLESSVWLLTEFLFKKQKTKKSPWDSQEQWQGFCS